MSVEKNQGTRRKHKLTSEEIWNLLEQVKDPEIPVVSVVELGIIRQVDVDGETVRVRMTPTFSGCPALQEMQNQIEARLRQAGAVQVDVQIILAPPWSTDWIAPEARQKLRDFGLAPPPVHGGNFELASLEMAACPYCSSTDTSLKNSFGSTLCRAIFYCNHCQQPFEQFKPL